MRILWVKVGGLWPLTSGGRQRTFHMLSELSRQHQVVFVTTHGPGDDLAGLQAALPRCEEVVSVPFAPPKHGTAQFGRSLVASWFSRLPVDLWKWRAAEVRRVVAQRLRQQEFDVVIADFLVAVPNVPADAGAVPVVLFEHNVEYLIWKRLRDIETRWWKRLPLELEWRKLRRAEARACQAASMTITVSDDDRRRLLELAPAARFRAVPTGVDTNYFAPAHGRPVANRLVFSGSMDWYPNEDAVIYFVESILPRIRAEVPDVSLTVVGRRPSAKVQELAGRAGVTVTGTVDDVRPHVAEAAVCIVPLRAGGGTRLKIFEALAMGKAVLSTTVGAEGLELESGRQLVLADGPEAFSREAIALLRNPRRCDEIGAEGRRLVEARYPWATVTETFEQGLREALVSDATATQAAGHRVWTEA